jgi:heme-degrading monooxygenase HmoA
VGVWRQNSGPPPRITATYNGFRGLSLAEPTSGKGLTISLWGSEEAMKQAEQTANRLRASTAAATGADIVSVDRYEVVVSAVNPWTV